MLLLALSLLSLKAMAGVLTEQEVRYFYYAAIQALHSSRYDDALACLLHCEELDPQDAAVKHYLSVLYGGLNNQERANTYAAEAYRLCPEEYWQYLIQVYQTGETDYAVRELEKLSKRLPENTEVLETLQRIYQREGEIRKALLVQDRLDKVEGKTAYGAVQRYSYLMELGKRKQAEAAIRDYLKEDPSNYYFQVFLGDSYMQDNRRDEALKQYRAIAASYPENPYLHLSLANWYGSGNMLDSAAYYETLAIENPLTGLDYKMQVLKDYPWLKTDSLMEDALRSLTRQYPTEAGAQNALAQFYLKKERPQEAEPLLWTVLDITPDNDAAWQSLLSIYQSDSTVTNEDFDRLVSRALVQRPEQRQWYYLKALVEVRKDLLDSAIWYCHQGLLQPEEKDLRYTFSLYVQLGDTYMHLHQADSAYVYYEKALTLDPESAYVLNNYAYFLAINGGDLRKAEKMSARSLKQQPNNATFLDTYAWILHLQGQEVLARFYMQQAWDNAPDKDDPDLLEHYKILNP